MRIGLHCGGEWDNVGHACGTRVAGLLPPSHPGSEFAQVAWNPLTFRGTFEHALDAKHRLTVPAKFRAELAGGVVLAASPETSPGAPRSIAVWKPDAYEKYTEAALQNLNPMEPKARELSRFFFNNSYDTELDSAHRVMIPPPFMKYASLDREVIVTGSGDCLEVWDRTGYQAYNEDVLARIPDIAASFAHTT
jgi:MraZ protein